MHHIANADINFFDILGHTLHARDLIVYACVLLLIRSIVNNINLKWLDHGKFNMLYGKPIIYFEIRIDDGPD